MAGGRAGASPQWAANWGLAALDRQPPTHRFAYGKFAKMQRLAPKLIAIRPFLVVLAVGTVLACAAPDERSGGLLRNTLALVALTTVISLPLGTVLAWLLVRTDLPGRRLALIALGATLFVPLYLHAAAWQAGFGLQGWYTLWFGGPVWLDGLPAAAWVHAMTALPWVVLITGVGFRLVEPELEEQALLDGSPAAVFARVTLPTVLPAIGVAAFWVAVMAAGEITATDLFGVRTYAEELYYPSIVVGSDDRSVLETLLRAVAPGVILSGWLLIAGLLLFAKLVRRDRPVSVRPCLIFRLGRFRGAAMCLVAGTLLMVIGIPLLSLVCKAGVVVTQTDDGRLRSWSLLKCVETVATSPWEHRREFGWSAVIGLSAASAATLVGIHLAWLARAGRRWARIVLVACAVGLTLPGPAIGLAVIAVLNRPELPFLTELYDRTILAPWLVTTLRGLPPTVLILWLALGTVPRELLDAAALDGASSVQRLWHVALPTRAAAVGLAWLVALVVSLGDLAATILVRPPGIEPMSVHIFGLLHYGVEDQVAGICLAQVGLFATLAAATAWLANRVLTDR